MLLTLVVRRGKPRPLLSGVAVDEDEPVSLALCAFRNSSDEMGTELCLQRTLPKIRIRVWNDIIRNEKPRRCTVSSYLAREKHDTLFSLRIEQTGPEFRDMWRLQDEFDHRGGSRRFSIARK
jgi:hypothetical protein